ncbi:MAG: hypothetical protein HY815_03015 [Candidatus Riflebacteria bacterium]|nr:hypothetical protein [Candidatus Riflebacteria bacterium]
MDMTRQAAALLLVMLSILGSAGPIQATDADRIQEIQRRIEQQPTVRDLYKLGALFFFDHRYADAVVSWKRLLKEFKGTLTSTSKFKVVKAMTLAYEGAGDCDKAYGFAKWLMRQQPGDDKIQRLADRIRRKCSNSAGDSASKPTTGPVSLSRTRASPSPTVAPRPDLAVAKAKFREGEMAYQQGRVLVDQCSTDSDEAFSRAIGALEVAKRGEYDLARTLYLLGSARLNRDPDKPDELTRARDDLEKSLALDNDERTLFDLAQVYGFLGEKEKEVDHYERALALNPKWAECHFKAALAYDKMDTPGAAAKTFAHAKAAIAEKPEYKKRFQEVLKNSRVAQRIADEVIAIVRRSEDDQLSDKEIEDAAQRLQNLIGPTGGDKGGLSKERLNRLISSQEGRKLLDGVKSDKVKSALQDPKKREQMERVYEKIKGSSPSPR